MSGLIKYLLAQAALKGGKKLAEGMDEEPQEPQEAPQPPQPLTEAQMADPMQRSMYEAQMKRYMEWEQAQRAQMPQPGGLLDMQGLQQ